MFQIHHQINLGFHLDRAHAEQTAHIHHANAAQFDIMADQLRRRTGQHIGNTADFHRIVGNQPVTALDKLDGRFAFADAGIAHNQHTLAVNLHQYAVAGNAGGQITV